MHEKHHRVFSHFNSSNNFLFCENIEQWCSHLFRNNVAVLSVSPLFTFSSQQNPLPRYLRPFAEIVKAHDPAALGCCDFCVLVFGNRQTRDIRSNGQHDICSQERF
jgi:hypothetical protein